MCADPTLVLVGLPTVIMFDDAFVFFTFWGLDIITTSKVDHLHVNLAGNASSGMPTVLAGLPGMESLAASMMKKQMAELDLPSVRGIP